MKGKGNHKLLTAIQHILALSVLGAALTGCQGGNPIPATAEPTTETIAETTSTSVETWSMQAALVNDKGEVLETTELTAKVMVWDQGDGRDYYNVTFDYPEDVYNTAPGVMPYPTDDMAYTCCAGFGYEKGEMQASEAIQFYFGLDLEKECFIMDIDDGQDVYLLASRSPDADVAALWAHFQDFIDMVPDHFPTIIG